MYKISEARRQSQIRYNQEHSALLAEKRKIRNTESMVEANQYKAKCAETTWLTIEQVETLQKRGFAIREIMEWIVIGNRFVPTETIKYVKDF